MFTFLRKGIIIMVGYNKTTLIDTATGIDGSKLELSISRQKIVASFYKIMICDSDDLETYKDDIVTILFIMYILHEQKTPKNEDKSPGYIAENTATHSMNRALYDQNSLRRALDRPSDVPVIQLLSMKSISEGNLAAPIAMIMIYFNKDFQDIIVSTNKIKYYIGKLPKMFSKPFISMEDIIYASNNYNS